MATKALKAKGLTKATVLDTAGTTYTVSGSTSADKVHVLEGVSAKKISLGKGSDQIHLAGDSIDYTVSFKTSKTLTLSNVDGDVKINIVVDSTTDKIFFADGYVDVNYKGSMINFGDLQLSKGDTYSLDEEAEDYPEDGFELTGVDVVSEVLGSEPINLDDLGGTPESAVQLEENLADGSYLLVDDVTTESNVIIGKLGKDDKIKFTGTTTLGDPEEFFTVESLGKSGNVNLTFEVDGVQSTITVTGVYSSSKAGPVDLETFNAVATVGDIIFA